MENKNKVIDHIVGWMNTYLQEARMKGFVVGVSGGVDSALTSKLAAMTGAPLLCVEMPIHQHPNQINRARKHIERLMKDHSNVTTVEVNLTPVFDHFLNELPEVEDSEKKLLSLANTRARIRMSTLYYFASMRDALVVGTGNKVEDFGVGFFTKYGDGGVDISPIADLVKTEVYELADELGVIEEIMMAPPTDGLWGDDRTDEDQIGASYKELEWAMQFTGDDSDLEDRQLEVLKIYRNLNAINQHKMQPIPVCKLPSDFR